ncbi:MAG TPA: 2-oxoacid:acceptor oxidoreductase subunit alpha [Candidatus Latescibacteria bacterium]|jgi:2-oxoglutarate ferredoxin oxidoreductase subunit alpha|nr:pyruvate ferredoxin oxidoreductase [Gemmatimonadaceae bacterium]MDP6015932.1 2-oxoacid:acceptor oxidoreductase subunit alpha [Candidatus Latescibacterota bacterium]HJP34289.1 2-oxoacid:acceptor oxidoreductase subunit alpha [Candidatus Latescibacterota bacterium]|tara:strand:+ start:797 stop:1918 length:1122 start_codon:yes stop_codon:yes gene_type:complete
MTAETRLLQGNAACAEGALAAGCRFFAGYPITPATEIAEHLARELPPRDGVFIQMEDEIASMGAVIGASWAGAMAMTATSGPGMSLMQENIGYAVSTETPCVVVDVQRGGPSTGIPAVPSQSDMVQAARGSHGDYEIVALAPSSAQEMFDLTVRAFDLAERLRTPVLLLADAAVGHMREIVEIPATVVCTPRRVATADGNGAPRFLDEQVAPMPLFGHGLKAHVTGSCHDEAGMRNVVDAEALDHYVRRLSGKIRHARDDLMDVRSGDTEDAEVILIGWGGVGRAAQAIATRAREAGQAVGWIRPITVWPFADTELAALCQDAKRVLVLENNLGQMLPYVQAAVGRRSEVDGLPPRILGTLHRPEDVLQAVAA